MSKFHVVWTDGEGNSKKEVFNSYYLATVRKGKLTSEGYSADIIENGATTSGTTDSSLRYSQAEKKMLRKLKRETSDKIREGNKKIYGPQHKDQITKGRLGQLRRARAFKLINKGGLR